MTTFLAGLLTNWSELTSTSLTIELKLLIQLKIWFLKNLEKFKFQKTVGNLNSKITVENLNFKKPLIFIKNALKFLNKHHNETYLIFLYFFSFLPSLSPPYFLFLVSVFYFFSLHIFIMFHIKKRNTDLENVFIEGKIMWKKIENILFSL